jgi:hypothetical protein
LWPPLHPCAQTADGKEAKATTGEEFGDVMAYLKAKVDVARSAGTIGWDPIWSFDHAHPHDYWADGSCARSQPWAGFERALLPPLSPDFHKVIEHTFARFKQFLRELVYMEVAGAAVQVGSRQLSDIKVLDLCAAALHKAAGANVIARDVQSLRTTLEVVNHEKGERFMLAKNGVNKEYVGSGGDWPPKSLR